MHSEFRYRLRLDNGVNPPSLISVIIRTEIGGDAGISRLQLLPAPQTDLFFPNSETRLLSLLLHLFHAGQRSYLQKRLLLESTRYCYQITFFLFLHAT